MALEAELAEMNNSKDPLSETVPPFKLLNVGILLYLIF